MTGGTHTRIRRQSPDHVHAGWKRVHRSPLCTRIKNANLGVGHTTAEAGLRVRLVLDLPIALEGTCNPQQRRSACHNAGSNPKSV